MDLVFPRAHNVCCDLQETKGGIEESTDFSRILENWVEECHRKILHLSVEGKQLIRSKRLKIEVKHSLDPME
jgi:hypothetical protein